MSSRPGERPAPRASTRTTAYPHGTQVSGSTVSQVMNDFVEPGSTSGCVRINQFHCGA